MAASSTQAAIDREVGVARIHEDPLTYTREAIYMGLRDALITLPTRFRRQWQGAVY